MNPSVGTSKITLPQSPKVIICHNSNSNAAQMIWYPGVKYINRGTTVAYTSNKLEWQDRTCSITIKDNNIIECYIGMDAYGYDLYIIY